MICFKALNISALGRDSSVDIAIHYGLDGPGIESRRRRDFSASVQTVPGAHPAFFTVGNGCLFRG